MTKSSFIIVLIALIANFYTKAQDTQKFSSNGVDQTIISDALEYIQAASDDQQIDMNLITDALLQAAQNPIELNKASVEELESLPFINPLIAQNIVHYIANFGTIRSYSELMRIDGIDIRMARLVQSFTTLQNHAILSAEGLVNETDKQRTELSFLSSERFPKTQGFSGSSPKFNGHPRRYYLRFKHEVNSNIRFGLISEQDAGEPWKNKPDFTSFYAQINFKQGLLKTVTLGDFHINFGQNVLIGPTFTLSKSPYLGTWYRSGKTIKPNTSATESGFRRGIATTIKYRKYNATVFGSYEQLDLNSGIEDSAIGNINLSGLHRTETELNKRHNTHQFVAGLLNEVSWQNITLGAGIVHAFRQYTFSNEQTTYALASVHAKYRLNNGILFTEVAKDLMNNSYGISGGIIYSLSSEVNFASHYRNYDRNYDNPFANALKNSTTSANEKGILTGLEIHPHKQVNLNIYIDQYQQQSENTGASFTEKQTDFLAQIKWTKKRKWETYLRFRKKLSPSSSSNSSETIPIGFTDRSSTLRLNNVIFASSMWRLSQRIEYRWNSDKSTGLLIFSDIQWRPKEIPWALDLRYAIFDTDGFDGRIYAFEASLPYSFSIPAYYNRGTRKYIKLKYTGFRNVSIWVLYSIWNYTDVQTISSGDNLIDSNIRRELGVVIRYRW